MAFSDPDFDGFDRGIDRTAAATTMTRYKAEFTVAGALRVAGRASGRSPRRCRPRGRRQLHVAETEKYAHVTFFFNGGREEPFDGERRILVPSPAARGDLRPCP